jgi:hypothetical protein
MSYVMSILGLNQSYLYLDNSDARISEWTGGGTH